MFETSDKVVSELAFLLMVVADVDELGSPFDDVIFSDVIFVVEAMVVVASWVCV